MISAAVPVQGRGVDRSPCRRRAGRWRRRRARHADLSSYNDASSRTGGVPSRGRRPGSGRTRWRTSRTFPFSEVSPWCRVTMRARGRGRRGSPGDSGATNARFEGIAGNVDACDARLVECAPVGASMASSEARGNGHPQVFAGGGFDGQEGPRTASPTRIEANARVTNPENQGLPTWHLIAPVMTWHPPQPLCQDAKKIAPSSQEGRVVVIRAAIHAAREGATETGAGLVWVAGCSAERARSAWPPRAPGAPRARSGRARGSRRVTLVPRRSRASDDADAARRRGARWRRAGTTR